MRFFKNCPFLSIIVLISLCLFIYGILLTAGVLPASNTVNFSVDPETVGVAAAMQDIKSRFSNLVEGVQDRDYTVDYMPTEYVPDEELANNLGVDTGEDEEKGPEEEKEESESEKKDAEAAARRAERSERMKNGESEEFLKEAFKTRLPENDASDTGDSYDGFYSVGDGYFTGGDTVIIGDSREQGFGLYSGLDGIVSYAQKSYGVHQVFTKRWIDSEVGKLTLEEAMALNKGRFRKIYIMFGLNEMGWADETTFDNAYYQLIDMLKYYQPDAVIYVQSIINVTKSKSQTSNVFNNENITRRNEALKVVAEKEHVAYLDLNSVLTDEEGNLPEYYASDGIHISQKYMYIWVDFLKSHAVLSSGSDTQYVTGYTPEKDVSDIGENEEAGENDGSEAEESPDSENENNSESENAVDTESGGSDNIEIEDIAPAANGENTTENWETGEGIN